MGKSERYGAKHGFKRKKRGEERRMAIQRERDHLGKKEKKLKEKKMGEHSWRRELETKLKHPFLMEEEGELLRWSEDQDHNQPLRVNYFQKRFMFQ